MAEEQRRDVYGSLGTSEEKAPLKRPRCTTEAAAANSQSKADAPGEGGKKP